MCVELGSQDASCYLRKFNEELNPSFLCDLFQRRGAVAFFIHDVYVDCGLKCSIYQL